MSDTPRTDALRDKLARRGWNSYKDKPVADLCVEMDQLERELAKARELFTQSLKDRESAEKETDAMLDRLIAEEKQRDMLAEALETLMYGQEIDAGWEIAKQALATVKGGSND